MFLVYTPDGAADVQRMEYRPKKLMSAERETIERHTGKHFAEFTQDVLKGNSRCRRVLLWTLLRRDHRGLKLEDVDFSWDELKLEYSKQEYQLMRDNLSESLSGNDLASALEKVDAEIETAYDDAGAEGKAAAPIAD